MQDAGVYQAKVVSSAGECCSSYISVEVEPGCPNPELPGNSRGVDFYGAKMAAAASENDKEVDEARRRYGLPFTGIGGYSGGVACGWLEGLVGSWKVRNSWKERYSSEKDGRYLAKDADNERLKMFDWIIKLPYSESPRRYQDCWDESELQFTVTDEVRHALIRIWVQQDRELQVHLEWNHEAIIKHLNEEEDWPDQPLLKFREKMSVDTSLNHNRDSIMELELEQSDAWFDSFVEDPVGKLRWPGFRVQKIKSKPQNCQTEAFSSSESSSSEEDDGRRMEHIDWKKEPMSVRVGDEGEESDTSDKEEVDEDATSKLQRMLLDDTSDHEVGKNI